MEINDIFNKVSGAQPSKKIETIDSFKPKMIEIEQEIEVIE